MENGKGGYLGFRLWVRFDLGWKTQRVLNKQKAASRHGKSLLKTENKMLTQLTF